jgi:hypothetical protein
VHFDPLVFFGVFEVGRIGHDRFWLLAFSS